MKEETVKKIFHCYVCGFLMIGNGFCSKHSTNGQDYFIEDGTGEIRQHFIKNNYDTKKQN